jgi:hypothetical protein
MKAMVTGATGFVGPRLLRLLDSPVVLSRNADRARTALGSLAGPIYRWDPLQGPPPAQAFEGVDVVLHLAGESVAEGRWTAAQKARIRDSRVIGTRHLVQGIAQAAAKPKTLVSASAVGYYGDRGEEELTETAAPAHDFLADVCVEWEREALAAQQHGVRVVTARTGIVLGAGGGALAKMLTPFKLGAGGPLGNGRQWMPWIHVADLAPPAGLHAGALFRPAALVRRVCEGALRIAAGDSTGGARHGIRVSIPGDRRGVAGNPRGGRMSSAA